MGLDRPMLPWTKQVFFRLKQCLQDIFKVDFVQENDSIKYVKVRGYVQCQSGKCSELCVDQTEQKIGQKRVSFGAVRKSILGTEISESVLLLPSLPPISYSSPPPSSKVFLSLST